MSLCYSLQRLKTLSNSQEVIIMLTIYKGAVCNIDIGWNGYWSYLPCTLLLTLNIHTGCQIEDIQEEQVQFTMANIYEFKYAL